MRSRATGLLMSCEPLYMTADGDTSQVESAVPHLGPQTPSLLPSESPSNIKGGSEGKAAKQNGSISKGIDNVRVRTKLKRYLQATGILLTLHKERRLLSRPC